jgi:hypothetical protein
MRHVPRIGEERFVAALPYGLLAVSVLASIGVD